MKTLVSDLIGRLVPEGSERKKRFGRSKGVLEQLITSFERFEKMVKGKSLPFTERDFGNVPSANNKDIQAFYDIFMNTVDNSLFTFAIIGTYLSKVINSSYEQKITLKLDRERIIPAFELGTSFGIGTPQELHIYGNAGTVGVHMASGLIHVHGTAEDYIGEGMTGGKIIIDKRVGSIGSFTKGTIICKQHCERVVSDQIGIVHAKSVGEITEEEASHPHRKAGILYVKDWIGGIDESCRYTVYVKGKKYWSLGQKAWPWGESE